MAIKQRKYKYKVLKELPAGAVSVRTLADRLGYSSGHIYKKYGLGQLKAQGWDLVMYEGYNFAIPTGKVA